MLPNFGVGGSPLSVIHAARLGFSLMLAIISGTPSRFAPFSQLFQGDQSEDLAGYFVHDGRRISKINAPNIVDLERQERLTRRLLQCSPEYFTLPSRTFLSKWHWQANTFGY